MSSGERDLTSGDLQLNATIRPHNMHSMHCMLLHAVRWKSLRPILMGRKGAVSRTSGNGPEQAHNPEVVGSNPTPATIEAGQARRLACFLVG